MKDSSAKILYSVFFIFLAFFLIGVIANNNFISNFLIDNLGLKIVYLRLFGFPLFFLGFIFLQILKGKKWPSLKSDIIYGSLFTVLSVIVYTLLFV